jgi:hypothetical protein
MKRTAFLISFILFQFVGAAQTVSYDDFRSIIPFLQKEDFKSAFNASKKILNETVYDSSDLRGIVTYINLYSSAGMVSKGEMSYDDFEKNSKQFIGQYLVMSAHPCVDSGKLAYNSLSFFRDENGRVKGRTTTANSKATSILLFEYFDFAEAVDPQAYIGKNVRCGGILEDFKPNPNKSIVLIGRMYIKNAFIRDMTPR